MQKNVTSQKWIVFAFDETDNTPKPGDAAQITAEISKDGAVGGGDITDAHPTELEDGYYVFDIEQGESNADLLLILPESSTPNIQVIGVPGSVYTTEPNRNKLSVDSNGRTDIIKVAGTTQSANDIGADTNTILTNTEVLVADIANILIDTGELQVDDIPGKIATLDTVVDGVETKVDTAITDIAAVQTEVDKIDAIPTTMVGTDNAALASVVGALNNAAAAGEVTSVDTLMQYLKQLINILIGTPGIGTFPAESAPGNAVSLAEVIRAIHVDVTGINGDPVSGAPVAVSGTIVDVSSGVYDLTATLGTLSGVDDTYNNMIICFFDNSGSIYETKRITDYDGTGVTRVTVDADLSFPPQDGVDTFVIYRAAYAPVGAASISDGDMNTMVDKFWDEASTDHKSAGSTGLKQYHSGRGRY